LPGKNALKPIHTPPRNAASFSEVIKTHLDSLYSAALRLTQNEMDAEDLVQTTCLKALQGFAQLRDTRRAKSWLFRILTYSN
jgi:RNA polymerase sigma-70 factor (ECF subfamily)